VRACVYVYQYFMVTSRLKSFRERSGVKRAEKGVAANAYTHIAARLWLTKGDKCPKIICSFVNHVGYKNNNYITFVGNMER
jgi:hypothetical protein